MNSRMKFARLSRALGDVLESDAAQLAVTFDLVATDRLQAALVSAALMPQVHELAAPLASAAEYRRATRRMQELKQLFNAQAAQSRSLLRQWRRNLNP